MSLRVPSCRPRDVHRVLLRIGFAEKRQRGSHRAYFRASDNRHVTIAWHPRDIPRGTLKEILKQAGLTEVEFIVLLRRKKAA